MKKIELLSPAGNMDSLKAAVSAGCDAVYLGLQSFSARAFAGNFSHEQLQEAVRFCHIRNIKVYVTINTMLYEAELEKAEKEVDFLYRNDVDGLLIQDAGLFDYVRHVYPDFDVHCSTQMHIHNLAGVRFMKKMGARRVVLARETPIEFIRKACREGIDIEVFAYGAICISYSGQCLMSAAVKNRSANRGVCAQCCRLQYFPEKGKHFKEGDYILSPKDLNVINQIPELIEAGVSSLKIEGRMKRPEYVWLVTHIFREAIDAYYKGRTYQVNEQEMHDLLLMFNRGFSKGHLFHDDVTQRMSQFRPNHQGIEIGKVLKYHSGFVDVQLSAPLHQHDGLRIINEPHDTGLTAVKIYKKGKLVKEAESGDIVTLECHSEPIPQKGQSLHKTSDALLLDRIDQEMTVRHPVSIQMKYTAETGKPFILEISDNDGHHVLVQSEMICEQARKAPLSDESIENSLRKTGDTAYEAVSITGCRGNIFLPLSAVNETRRNALRQLDEQRAVRHVRAGAVKWDDRLEIPDPVPWKLFVKGAVPFEQDDIFFMNEENTRPVADENFTGEDSSYKILSSMNDLEGKHAHCIAYVTCNIANSGSIAFFLKHGCDGVMLSSEMDDIQIRNCLDAFMKRYHFHPFVIQLMYGKRTAMIIKDRFMKEKIPFMTDQQNRHYDLIYNRNNTLILEPAPVRHENRLCDAGLVIIHGEKNEKEIIEKAYEEVSERV